MHNPPATPALGMVDAAEWQGPAATAKRMFWAWSVALGVLLFATAWAWRAGYWGKLVDGDPSGISATIIVLSLVVTLWCGLRVRLLARECVPGSAWRRAYAQARRHGPEHAAARLSDASHGPHETAWWFAGATIKLGLLGTVVGFIFMVGQLELAKGFDVAQIQAMLAKMTLGMGIALLTTLVGLVANLWLGFQLLLLDRLADRVVGAILDGNGAH